MFIKKINFFYLAALLFILPVCGVASVEIRKITPPKLDAAHLGEKILCHRPMRQGSPNMSIEKRNGQLIAHNYGHGGSGWTLGPGSAAYVNRLLIKSEHARELTQKTPITIIGAGALGLFTAYDLIQNGFKDITIVAEKFTGLASHNAGGLLAPVSMNNNAKIQGIIDEIGIDAYKFYASIARREHPHFKKGAVIVPAYFSSRKDSALEPYVGKVMKPAKEVRLDFGNGTVRDVVVYDDGIFIGTAKMMTELHDYLTSKKVKFIEKKIQSFDEIEGKFIINCAGMGAAELNRDASMSSVQGHLIMLKDQNPAHLQHMIILHLDEGKTSTGHKIKRSFYMFPKQVPGTGINDVGVIGGTFIEGATSATPHNEEFDIMLRNAKQFYGIEK